MFRDGRMMSADHPAINPTRQLRLLELLAIDGAIQAVSERDYSMKICACVGSRPRLH